MIKFCRIDDRLIHGQVVTAWMNVYKVEQIIILNDFIASDPTQKNILAMAAPQGVKVNAMPVEKLGEILKSKGFTRTTMLLFKDSIDVLRAVNNGVPIEKLNVGGMGIKEGRERLTKSVSVSSEERAAFKELLAKGIVIEIQMVPNDDKVKLEDLI